MRAKLTMHTHDGVRVEPYLELKDFAGRLLMQTVVTKAKAMYAAHIKAVENLGDGSKVHPFVIKVIYSLDGAVDKDPQLVVVHVDVMDQIVAERFYREDSAFQRCRQLVQ